MNFNILAYLIYLPIIAVIMIKVGWMLYTHGEHFLNHIFKNDTGLVKSINTLLLMGYYLVNLGYAIFTIAFWEHVDSIESLFQTLSSQLGLIIIGLAVLHYNNVLCLFYFVSSKSLKS